MSQIYPSLSDPAGLLPPGFTPFWPSEPALGGWYGQDELTAVMQVIRDSMDWRIGFKASEHTEALEDKIANMCGAIFAVAFNGAGTALDLIMRALAIEPGDEVISCSMNFHGTHLAILGAGAKLVLSEPDPVTLNFSVADVEQLFSARTRAVIVTSLHGLVPDLDALQNLIESMPHTRGDPVKIIVDASRALGATHNHQIVGRVGWATVFSMQSKKAITALGEGGIVTTNDRELAENLRRYRSFGHSLSWGSNFKMTKVQAAVAQVQLACLEEKIQMRIKTAREITRLLAESPELILPAEPEGYRHTFAFYPILLTANWDRNRRDSLMARLAINHGVGSVVANPPTYLYNFWIRQRVGETTPKAEELSDRLFCPCFHPLLSGQDIQSIAQAILTALEEV